MTTLRFDAPDGRVVTATSGGVIVVWADGTQVGNTDGIVRGPISVDLLRERPRSVDELANWYRDVRRDGLDAELEVLTENEDRARRQLEIAAEAYAEASARRRKFVADNRL